jgi:pSer/pThr/pTyr-binding forkhead associated (FHA) protein
MTGWILDSTTEPATRLRLPAGAVKTVGRTARADFILDAALVSRVHCRLFADASDQLVVEDLESTNGTRVNGKKITRSVVREGDTLSVGRVDFLVSRSDDGATASVSDEHLATSETDS